MPLKIETLFSDAAIEQDLLSGEELGECLDQAGDEGAVHQAAVEFGYLTTSQARRVYARIYQTLDKRYKKCKPVTTKCPECESALTTRFQLTYRLIPCPECLYPINLADGEQAHDNTLDERQLPGEQVELQVTPGRSSRADRTLPRQLAGYKIRQKLGAGGMGTVYHGENQTGEQVAIKVVLRDSQNDDELQRILSECQLLRELSHPKIRRLIKLKGDDVAFYLIMEYIEGQSLEELRASKGRLKPKVVLQIAYAIATALEHAHNHNILHRDVKPQNILLSTDRTVKLTDFGLAVSIQAITEWSVTGEMAGTPSYMSPEQCRGEKLDARSDLYSLGMTMYHCLSGRLPFEGDPFSVVYRQVHGRVPSLCEHAPEIPEPVVQLVTRLLARDPADRYPDAASLREDLRYVLSGKAPRVAPRADHISLSQLDEARKIQQELRETSGAEVPLEEILVRKGWIGVDSDTEAVEAREPYRCRCGKTNLTTALAAGFACPKCKGSLRFDADLSLRMHEGHLLVETLGKVLNTSERRTDRITRHLKAACSLGARQLVLDLSQAEEVDARLCGWMVDLAQKALQLKGAVSVLFPDSRSRDHFCSMGFDQFVRVYRSRAAFYEQETGTQAPIPAATEDGVQMEEEWAVTATLAEEPQRPRRKAKRRRKKQPSPEVQADPQSGLFRLQSEEEEPEQDEVGDSEARMETLQEQFYLAYEAGDYQGALDELLSHGDTLSIQGVYYRGICRWRLGLHDDAHDDLSEVLEQDDENSEAWYVRGLVCQAIGDADEAIVDYTHTIQLAPKHAKAYCNRAAVLSSIGELDNAAMDFQAALDINAKHVRSLYGLGRIHCLRGELMMSEVLLTQALDYDPRFAPAYYVLARIAARGGKLTESFQHLRQAINLNDVFWRKSVDEADFTPLREDPKLHAHYRGLELDARNAPGDG